IRTPDRGGFTTRAGGGSIRRPAARGSAPRRRGPAYREVFRAPVLVASAAGRPCFSAEVAFLLGFGDQSSVNRAFRRWTGESRGGELAPAAGETVRPCPSPGVPRPRGSVSSGRRR